MSKFDNYRGVSHDPAFDGGDTLDWNPCDHIGDIDKDAIWEIIYTDPTQWLEAEVWGLVFEVEVPEHDEEGNATDGSPYIIPDDLIGAKRCFVAGCHFDWGHYCDGNYEHCPKDATLEDAKMRAEIACEGPLEGADTLLTNVEEPWLPGSPEVLIDESDSETPVAALRYWREVDIEPYDSEYLGFDADKGPAEVLWRYAEHMGWLVAPPNTTWVMFTKRTEDPKLAYLERRLKEKGIPSRRHSESFHAPILEAPEGLLDDAWEILDEVIAWQGTQVRLDDIPDDDPMFV